MHGLHLLLILGLSNDLFKIKYKEAKYYSVFMIFNTFILPVFSIQVTPDEIKLKAKQMVELVRASQVIQTKKLPPSQGTSKPPSSEGSGKQKKPKKMIRVAGGQVWEDTSLLNWDHNDFRLFCGDLGNDVTDEVSRHIFKYEFHVPVIPFIFVKIFIHVHVHG